MNFNTSAYGLFLAVVFASFWCVRDWRLVWVGLLLVASYAFYAAWQPWYLLLIFGSTLLDYVIGGRLARDDLAPRARRWLLGASLAGNLGLLGVFKYYGFFRGNVEAVLGVALPDLNVLLPVGISFYTFQSLSYTIDLYRRQIAPARSFGEFALFVAFFPQLVAGPIVRARDFLPQLGRRPALEADDLHAGLYRILVGLGKKVVVADVLAVTLVDPVFAPGSQASGAMVLLGVYGYALQIYCDFSGYSDIAIGSARLLGFQIPENFDAPYRARSIQDFWRRWHISLSGWLRDYLYIPLGGNRRSAGRTYLNLMLTMLLGGLWHGAAWRFVVWGGLHGAWLAVNRWWDRRGGARLPGALGHAASIALTFHLVCLAWVFFRATDLSTALGVLGRLGGAWSVPVLAPAAWLALALGFGTHFLPRHAKEVLRTGFVRQPSWAVGAAASLVLGVLAHAEVAAPPFIYFQF